MNKLYIVDADIEFRELVSRVCKERGGSAEPRFFDTSLEIFSALKEEAPAIVFLSLDISDLDEFVMYDLLKKTNVNYSVPVLIIYSDHSEEELTKYENLKFKGQGYFKKPLDVGDIGKILDTHLIGGDELPQEPANDLVNEPVGDANGGNIVIELPDIEPVKKENARDDNEFSDENIDLLVRGQLMEEEPPAKPEMQDTKHELMLDLSEQDDIEAAPVLEQNAEEDTFLGALMENDTDLDDSQKEIGSNGFDLGLEEEPVSARNEKGDSRADRELAVQIISLESQNEFLRTENKDLSKTVENLQEELGKMKSNLAATSEKLELKEREHSDMARQLKYKIDEMQNQVEGKPVTERTENENLARKVDLLEKHTAQLQDEKSELTHRLHDMDSEKNSLHDTITGLKDQLGELVHRAHELEQLKIEIENEKKELSGKMDGMSSETMELNRQLLTVTEEKSGLKDQVEESAKQNEVLQDQLNEANKKLEHKEQELDELMAKINNQEKQLGQLKDEKNTLKEQVEDLNQLMSGMEELKTGLERRVDELSNSLTDKERELVARNHQFEVHLKNKLDEVLQENEERLRADFTRREETLMNQLKQLNDEKQESENRLSNDLNQLRDQAGQLHTEYDDLKRREESLNRTVSNLAEEKVALSERVVIVEENLAERDRMIQKNEEQFNSQVQNLKKEIEDMRRRADFYKDRINDVADLLKQAHTLTQVGENGRNG